MSEEPILCAFCHSHPYVGEQMMNGGYMKDFVDCRNFSCPSSCLPFDASISEWNTFQSSVLAQRRKDFEAGVEWAYENIARSDTHHSQFFDKYLEKERGE